MLFATLALSHVYQWSRYTVNGTPAWEVPIVVGLEAGPDNHHSGMKPILRPEGGHPNQKGCQDSVIAVLSLHSHLGELSIHGFMMAHPEIARRLVGPELLNFPKLR